MSRREDREGHVCLAPGGEAGALEVLGRRLRTVVVHVGDWTRADWSPYFTRCRTVALIDNGLEVENQEQGQADAVCCGLRAPWTAIWPRLRHLS